MRYKAISSAIAVLLIATPAFAQKSVPILIQTLRTTNPTTVITGQSLEQTYLVRFIDLSHKGEEIIIKREDLDLKSMVDFEVTNFEIEYETKQGQFLEHRWYLKYTLRIINPEKGPKILSSFVVPWKHKKAGQQENDPTIQYNYDLKTEEVHLNYVTTIPEKDPYLIIRDQIVYRTFGISGFVLKSVSWFLAVVPLGLWLVFFVNRLRSLGKHSRIEESKTVQPDGPVFNDIPQISKRKALRELHKSIKRLDRMATGKRVDSASKIMPELYRALMNFLRIKINNSTVGTTGTEMPILVKKINDSFSKRALAGLAERAAYYQSYIEKGDLAGWPVNPIDDVKLLRKSLRDLSWHMTIINYPRSIFRRSR